MFAPLARTAWALLAAAVLAAPARALDAQSAIEALLRNTDLGPARVSVTVMDVQTGRVLVALDADAPMIPASNQKLITTAAALDLLGPDFVYETTWSLIPPPRNPRNPREFPLRDRVRRRAPKRSTARGSQVVQE